jgi:hypothetical protein
LKHGFSLIKLSECNSNIFHHRGTVFDVFSRLKTPGQPSADCRTGNLPPKVTNLK